MPILSQKHVFDIPDDVAYLNNAYMSPLMRSVSAVMEERSALKRQPWTYSASQFFSFAEEARRAAAEMFGSGADDVAIIPSVSYGIETAVHNLSLSAGQSVLVFADQFPSHVYPWQRAARNVGAEVRFVPSPADHDLTAALLEHVDASTAVIAVPHIHWMSGIALDLVAVRKAADRVGAALVLDLTQSLGAMPFDVRDVRPDFAVVACYKWLMGPYSVGFLYADPQYHDGDPLEENWVNRAGAENFASLTDYTDHYAAGARRFDMGEKSNPAQLGGASEALRQLLDWDVDRIAESLAAKGDRILSALEPLGFTAAPKERRAPHYLGLTRAAGLPDDLLARLADEKIYVSVRGSTLRVTPHLYTDAADIERFITAIGRLL